MKGNDQIHSESNKLKIAGLSGDGIGREVTVVVLPLFEVLELPVLS